MHRHTSWPGLMLLCSRCFNYVLALRLMASILCKSQSLHLPLATRLAALSSVLLSCMATHIPSNCKAVQEAARAFVTISLQLSLSPSVASMRRS